MRHRRTPPAFAAARPSHEMRCSAGCWTKRNFFPTTACARFQKFTNSIRFVSRPAARLTKSATGRPNRAAACSAAIPTGAARSGCRSIFCIIESLQKFHHYYGDDFKIECPTGSGKFLTINEVADELTRRLTRIVSERRGRPAAGVEISSQAGDRSAFQGLRFVPRIFPRRHRPRRRRVASDRLDRSAWQN